MNIKLVCIITLIVIAPVLFFVQDYTDRNFLCETVGCERKDISREFFHYYGKTNRVYIVKGRQWVVNGVIFKDASNTTFYNY